MREARKTWRQRDLRTPQGNLRPATRKDVINWVSQAWEAVSEEVVAFSFKATGLLVALDGSEDDILSDRLSPAQDAADRNVREEAIGGGGGITVLRHTNTKRVMQCQNR